MRIKSGRRALQALLAVFAILAGLVGMGSVSEAQPAVHQTVDVVRIDGGPNDGTATLVRTKSGVRMTMSTTVGGELFNLPANPPPAPSLGVSWEVGDATTNWFVVFSNPAGCTDLCGEDDVIAGATDPNGEGGPAQASVHYAAGHVAGSSSWHSAGSLREGDTSGLVFPSVPLQDAMTAEVHIIARSHGPVANLEPGELGKALNSLNGGCDDDNICGDAQAAIFAPPT
jgi:hypothetical protein